jgi:hypothetical protein
MQFSISGIFSTFSSLISLYLLYRIHYWPRCALCVYYIWSWTPWLQRVFSLLSSEDAEKWHMMFSSRNGLGRFDLCHSEISIQCYKELAGYIYGELCATLVASLASAQLAYPGSSPMEPN